MRAADPTVGDGVVVVDKPAGLTSHDVVGICRRTYRTRKVGHSGTLDPMATGVLVLGVNRATRLLTFLVGCDKDYLATMRFGASTITDDCEGEVVATASAEHLRESEIAEAVAPFVGTISQVPSAVSAIKVQGKRAYARVRDGEDVQLAGREVTVEAFEVLQVRRAQLDHEGALVPVVDVDVQLTVSSGTYVRALARDVGAALGVGGHLTALRRTRVGAFTVAHAHELAALEAIRVRDGDDGSALPLASMGDAVGHLPSVVVSVEDATRMINGLRIDTPDAVRGGEHVAVRLEDGRLVAVVDARRGTLRAHAVFATLPLVASA